MRWVGILSIVVMVAAVAGPATGLAQPGRGPGARHYDPSTVETVTGDVVGVEHVASPGGGVHVTLQTSRETLVVHLGPAWYVDARKPKLATGDHVTVEGSRVTVDGKPVLIARQVEKSGETLILRDAADIPAWAGGGRRGGPPD